MLLVFRCGKAGGGGHLDLAPGHRFQGAGAGGIDLEFRFHAKGAGKGGGQGVFHSFRAVRAQLTGQRAGNRGNVDNASMLDAFQQWGLFTA